MVEVGWCEVGRNHTPLPPHNHTRATFQQVWGVAAPAMSTGRGWWTAAAAAAPVGQPPHHGHAAAPTAVTTAAQMVTSPRGAAHTDGRGAASFAGCGPRRRPAAAHAAAVAAQ